ncbi:MAG TPA: two-component regulator propeller domain-containing protein [Puia sp.]|nr:two-component regulator propeller domain-containing protein [Puia sp.]
MKRIFPFLMTAFIAIDVFGQKQNALFVKNNTYNSQLEFLQEYHEAYPLGSSLGENNIRSISIDKNNTVYIASASGVYKKNDNESSWKSLPFNETDNGPAYAVIVDEKNNIWIANWKGVFQFRENSITKMAGTEGPISVLCTSQEGLYALGPAGIWLYDGNNFSKKNYPVAKSVRGAISDNHEGLWIATDVGLYHATKNGTTHFFKTDMLISAGLKAAAVHNDGSIWVAGLGGISVIKNNKRKKFITTKDGCPSNYINCIKKSSDGAMWVGTNVGVVRFYPDGKRSLRFSRRWLLDDHVNDIAFDQNNNAWIATENGVSAIKRRPMSLSSKQDYFYAVLMRRHIREPWIAGQCRLLAPGDTARWQPEDDDNDGEYTGNYLAMESFRYAVTHDEDARQKAKKAFHFLKLLQDITNGDGYFARSIVPVEWTDRVHDNNRVYSEREIAEELVVDPRYKPLETRWHKSADGKWLWKGDASSDEWCGHMMGYYFYYEMAADKEEKKIIREHVASLVDHLIAHDFTMVDVDGKHTHWSVWSPTLLNNDPEWAQDRYQNSMELLAFLKFAYYLTNNEKYQQHYLRLINKEHYLENMSHIPEQNPAWFIYFDVTLQAYLYPILLHCEKNPKLLAFYQQHMDKWMEKRKDDHNPLINFLYCYARNKKTGLQQSADFLVNTPLDLVDWNIDHTKREDVKIVHTPVLNEWQVNELPDASIRATVRWDNNPWRAISGSPETEKEPVFWLYPYWLGRYLKMIL